MPLPLLAGVLPIIGKAIAAGAAKVGGALAGGANALSTGGGILQGAKAGAQLATAANKAGLGVGNSILTAANASNTGAGKAIANGLSNVIGSIQTNKGDYFRNGMTAMQMANPGQPQQHQANYAQLPQSNGIQMQAYQSPQLNNYVNNLRRTY